MLTLTTDFIPNMTIIEAKGMVFSEQVTSINVAKDVLNSIKGMFGGKFDSYSEEYQTARDLAISHLEEQAEKLGADAIINIKIHYDQFINSDVIFIVVTANGTAVTVKA